MKNFTWILMLVLFTALVSCDKDDSNYVMPTDHLSVDGVVSSKVVVDGKTVYLDKITISSKLVPTVNVINSCGCVDAVSKQNELNGINSAYKFVYTSYHSSNKPYQIFISNSESFLFYTIEGN